ncbi:SCO family protein [Campylobacter sp. CCS1377]|uniref:SCO family protein n=1 Tax=Campylobacter sp. CCS1377 TaxID=3158229 RepID=A0AAU7E6S7_9BACT
MMKNLRYIFVFGIIISTFVASYLYFKNTRFDFELQSEKGLVGLKDFRGEKLIIYFGYTSCPDVCPSTLALISKALEQIPNSKVMVLFISLDPLRDKDIKKTNEWLRYFYPNAHALIAKDEEEIAKIAKNYGVVYQKVELKGSFMKYSIAHSSDLFLFDEKGEIFKVLKDLSYENFYKELKSFLTKT